MAGYETPLWHITYRCGIFDYILFENISLDKSGKGVINKLWVGLDEFVGHFEVVYDKKKTPLFWK